MKRHVRFPFPKGQMMAAPAYAWVEEFEVEIERGNAPHSSNGMVVVDICGPLNRSSHWLFQSYEEIRGQVEAAMATNAGTICLRIDSPGGDFQGCLELSRDIRAQAKIAGKKLVAFTDSRALSAAYAIACAADEIVITESAFVGSIGVWAPIEDQTALDKAMGRNIVIVTSGARKTDGNPHVPITDDAVGAMQTKIDAMASQFFGLVASARGIGADAVRAIEGADKFGADALKFKLADRVVNSWSEFISSVSLGASKEDKMDIAEALAALKAAAAAGDRKAVAALKAWDDDGDEDKDKKKKEEAAAAAPTPVFAAASPSELGLAQRLHAVEIELAATKAAQERGKLLAQRPDFSAAVRASLENAPVEFVRNAVATWEKRLPETTASTNATTATATRGDTQGSAEGLGASAGDAEQDFIDTAMGIKPFQGGVKHNGAHMTLEFMTPDQARALSETLKKAGA